MKLTISQSPALCFAIAVAISSILLCSCSLDEPEIILQFHGEIIDINKANAWYDNWTRVRDLSTGIVHEVRGIHGRMDDQVHITQYKFTGGWAGTNYVVQYVDHQLIDLKCDTDVGVLIPNPAR